MSTTTTYGETGRFRRRAIMGQWVRDIIMTDTSNPEAMAICYAKGWASSSKYMTKQEAAAVTDIANVFLNSKIVTFDEFKYFTGVTSLSGLAFYGCSKLTSITIPSSITTIQINGTLGACPKLETVTWNSSAFPYPYVTRPSASVIKEFKTENPVLKTENGCLYSANGKILYAVPNTYTYYTWIGTEETIGQYSFYHTSIASNITFPSTITTIETTSPPFYDCSYVTGLDLSNTSITTMGQIYRAVTGTSSLLSITFPSGLTTMTAAPILGSTGFTNLTIPATVTTMNGQYNTNVMTSLSSITFLSATPPSFNAAQGKGNLTAIYVPSASLSAYQSAPLLQNWSSIMVGV